MAVSEPVIKYSNLTMETLELVWNMLKVNSSVPVAEFEQVKVCWDRHKGKNTFSCQASAIYKLTLRRF